MLLWALYFVTHLSERLPRMGVRKNPTSGDKHQIRVMCFWDTPANNDENKVTVFVGFFT
jgi:hypothetical protein